MVLHVCVLKANSRQVLFNLWSQWAREAGAGQVFGPYFESLMCGRKSLHCSGKVGPSLYEKRRIGLQNFRFSIVLHILHPLKFIILFCTRRTFYVDVHVSVIHATTEHVQLHSLGTQTTRGKWMAW